MEEIETWVLLYIFCNLESAKYCVLVYKDKGIGCLHISTHLDLIKKQSRSSNMLSFLL